MKIAYFLNQYLYQTGELDIPTIGKFTVNPGLGDDTLQEVSFSRKELTKKFSPDVVDFITKNTGKISSLSTSDLESFLEDMRQFLNIGNPYYLEGIGTISRNRANEYDFIPETEKKTEKNRGSQNKEIKPAPVKENIRMTEDDFYGQKPKSELPWQRILSLTLLVALIGLGIWGAIVLFHKYKNDNVENKTDTTIPQNKSDEATVLNESTQNSGHNKTADSLKTQVGKLTGNNSVKYVLEVSDSLRSITRFNKLKSYGWNINREQITTGKYELFVHVDRPLLDSTRILDSLTRLTGRKVVLKMN